MLLQEIKKTAEILEVLEPVEDAVKPVEEVADKGLSIGAEVGISIGVELTVGAIAALIYVCCCKD